MADTTDHIDVLLPGARVDVFAYSADTKKLFDELKDDWRFARVTIDAQEQNIDAAISKYKEYSSPDLVIIGTDDIGEGFIEKLGELAAHCVEGTEAVVVGPENDVTLYRRLIGMGVRDYLVRPIQSEDMVSVIGNVLFDKIGISDSRLISVIGAKGGVGTTSIAQMLAWTCAEELNQKTILLDAAGGWSTLNVAFGAEPVAELKECLRNAAEGSDEDLARMYVNVTDNLTLFACGGDDLFGYAAGGDLYEKAIDRIMKTYPNVIIDLSYAPIAVRQRLTERSHEIVVVATPELPSLRMARSVLNDLKARRGSNDGSVDLVLNKRGRLSKGEISDKDIVTALEHTPQATVPYEAEMFHSAETAGESAIKQKGGYKIIQDLLPLAKKLTGYKGIPGKNAVQTKEDGLVNRLLSGLKKKD